MSTIIVFTDGNKIEVQGDVNTAVGFLEESTEKGKLMGFRPDDASLTLADADKLVHVNPANVAYAYERREGAGSASFS
jgi:hypothetical protein